MPNPPKKTYDAAEDLPESEEKSKQHYDGLAKKIDASIAENKREHKVLTDNDEHVKRKQDEQAARLDKLNETLATQAAAIEPILKQREQMDGFTATVARFVNPIIAVAIAIGAIVGGLAGVQWVIQMIKGWK